MSNQRSFASKAVTNFDTPEVSIGNAEFHYQYFVPDEMITKSEMSDQENKLVFVDKISKISKRVPRYVELSFQKPFISNILNPSYGRNIFQDSLGSRSIDIEDLAVINDEGKTSSFAFTGIDLQDTGVDGKMYLLVDGALKQEKERINSNLSSKANKLADSMINRLRSINTNLFDSADALSRLFSDSSDVKFIENSLINLESLGLQFLDNDKKSSLKQEYFDQVKNFVFNAKLNNKFVASIVLSAISDGVSVFSDELRQVFSELESRQKLFRAAEDSDKIKSVDYFSYLENDGVQDIKLDLLYRPTVKIVGYLIEKRRLLQSGLYVLENIFVLSGENHTVLNDPSVVYGSHYSYNIKVIYEVQAKCHVITEGGPDSSTGDVQLKSASFLVASHNSRNFSVTCTENIPPEAIEDLNIEWDYKTDLPLIYWSFPRNPYSDIKGFQIFVRSGISMDGDESPLKKPFRLLKEINFDDSIIPYKRRENVPVQLTDRSKLPVTYHLDRNFDQDLYHIYAVCSLDAHGFTSGYSEQYVVKYDRFRSKLTKIRISERGAPKQYPNLYIDNTIFSNIAKVSGTSEKLKIYFNPDAMAAYESKILATNEVGSIASSGIKREVPYISSTNNNAGFYVMNITNLDNHISEKVTLQINIEEQETKNKEN